MKTKTPWKVNEAPLKTWVGTGPGAWLGVAEIHGDSDEERLDNAEFIVRACNSHEALVEALRECEAFIRGLRMANLVGQHCIDADYRLTKATEALKHAEVSQ